MAVTVPMLMERVSADAADTTLATQALGIGQQLVTDYVGETVVPAALLDEAILRASVDVFNRSQAPNGVLMSAVDDIGDGSSAVLRTPADPLYSARQILSFYVAPLGFA